MNKHALSKNICALGASVVMTAPGSTAHAAHSPQPTPNFVIILTDDQGYQDLGCYGSPDIRTQHIDRMAVEGARFTDFHTASPVCTPSRAAFLTGCYPKRVGMHRGVLHPTATIGLNPEEISLAKLLKSAGYATACIGKWHLGHQPEFLPTRHGFDTYFGVPYSNDMGTPSNTDTETRTLDEAWAQIAEASKWWSVPLMRDEKIIEHPTDQQLLTDRYTDEAISFIEQNRSRPFFLYLAHSMPHVPLFVPPHLYNQDPQQAYRLVIEQVDASTGRILDTLRKLGLSGQTVVVFTSDNGPWLSKLHHGGRALPLRAGKIKTWEGGHRVPFVVWAPGRVPAGRVCHEFVSAMDLYPTFAAWAGVALPKDRAIDGKDIRPILAGTPGAKSPYEAFVHYSAWDGEAEALRMGQWKLRREGGKMELYDLSVDIGEKNNVASQYPERVAQLRTTMEQMDAEITAQARPVGRTGRPTP